MKSESEIRKENPSPAREHNELTFLFFEEHLSVYPSNMKFTLRRIPCSLLVEAIRIFDKKNFRQNKNSKLLEKNSWTQL